MSAAWPRLTHPPVRVLRQVHRLHPAHQAHRRCRRKPISRRLNYRPTWELRHSNGAHRGPVTSQPSGYGRPDKKTIPTARARSALFSSRDTKETISTPRDRACCHRGSSSQGRVHSGRLAESDSVGSAGRLSGGGQAGCLRLAFASLCLIPAGSLLAGEYNSGVTYGQRERHVQVILTIRAFPMAVRGLDLDKFVGHSGDGSAGLGDQVDSHVKRLIGGIAMSSLFAAGVQISQNHTNSGGSHVGLSVQYPNCRVGRRPAGRRSGPADHIAELAGQPTIKIRPGDASILVLKPSFSRSS